MSELDIQSHLDRVSRSFAFCIARLEPPMRDQVGLAYLLCRVLDTIEDAEWKSDLSQLQSFDSFLEILRQAATSRSLDPALSEVFVSELLDHTLNLNDSESLLMRDSPKIFEMLQSFAPDVREVIVSSAISMGQGMRSYAVRRNSAGGILVLRDLSDVNRYCFFVAGVVGEILSGLLRIAGLNRGMKIEASLADGFRFGLFLQKVNILKDRARDTSEGRELVPNVNGVFKSALTDSDAAFRYLLSIPREFESYRLFCAWSLFLGLASLPHIWRGEKIGRLETVGLLAQVERAVRSGGRSGGGPDEKLRRIFDSKQAPLLKEFRRELSSEPKDIASPQLGTYREFYVGRARDEDIAAGVSLSS